jgi:Uncharacterized protein conserved in bacteria
MNLLGRRRFLKYGLAAASAAALPAPAFAYPDRPIRLIVPFSRVARPTSPRGCGRRR